MFTGIIEETGTVGGLVRRSKYSRLTVRAKKVLAGTLPGDSISVNGVCLTVTKIEPDSFHADLMEETIASSTLNLARKGDRVNLERALSASSRIGGHLVSGHIDGMAKITSVERAEIARIITIRPDPALLRYIAEKGSIAVNGISLTVCAVDDDSFSVSLIPHTTASTCLAERKKDDWVNIECDLVAKYLGRLMADGAEKNETASLDEDFLYIHGF
jgi:riboflavin synthase